MNRYQLSAAFRRVLADHGIPVTDELVAALLAASDQHAAHMIELHARPPKREPQALEAS